MENGQKSEPARSLDDYFSDLALTLTTSEVAELFGVPISTVRYWCTVGYLVAEQRGTGSTWLVSTRDAKSKLHPKPTQ